MTTAQISTTLTRSLALQCRTKYLLEPVDTTPWRRFIQGRPRDVRIEIPLESDKELNAECDAVPRSQPDLPNTDPDRCGHDDLWHPQEVDQDRSDSCDRRGTLCRYRPLPRHWDRILDPMARSSFEVTAIVSSSPSITHSSKPPLRSTSPGSAPVTKPRSTTASPFTKTYSIPSFPPPGLVIVA